MLIARFSEGLKGPAAEKMGRVPFGPLQFEQWFRFFFLLELTGCSPVCRG